MNSNLEAVYYESKVQYYVITTVMVLLFTYLTFFNPDNIRNAVQDFLGIISLFAFISVCFYRTSSFYIYTDKFIWKKGSNKIECAWNDVLTIHYDLQRSSSTTRFGPSSSFFIETSKGLTKYADKTNIKLLGKYTFLSKGDELVSLIKSKSNSSEQTSSISVFRQTQKLWDWILIFLAIFLVPTIIILLYAFFTKDYI